MKLSLIFAGAGRERAEDFRGSILLTLFSALGASVATLGASPLMPAAPVPEALSRFFFLTVFFRSKRPNVAPEIMKAQSLTAGGEPSLTLKLQA